MNNKNPTQPLPLFEFFYRPDEVNTELANKLIVYRYPIPNGESAKAYQIYIERQLAGYRSAFLLRQQAMPRGLFIALANEEEIPPKVFAADKEQILPERVYYAQDYAPIWIRLIFRGMSVWNSYSRGYHKSGYPLLIINREEKETKSIEALRLDCASSEVNAEGIAKLRPFYAGVSLIGVTEKETYNLKSEYWEYDKNNILHRYLPTPNVKSTNTLYKVYKNRNQRIEQDFLNLKSLKAFKLSRPMILRDITKEFIQKSAKYGFNLQQEVLNLQPWLQQKTKYIYRDKKPAFTSISYAQKIDILDLRINSKIKAKDLLSIFDELLNKKGIHIQWQLLTEINTANLASYIPKPTQKILVLIDQIKGMENDRYQLTKQIKQVCAVQHLMVNPNAMAIDPVKKGLLKVDEADGEQLFVENLGSDFYNYTLSDLANLKTAAKSLLVNKLEVVLKELEIKGLLLVPELKISEVLKNQAQTLSSDILLISAGYLFTVKNDRPVIIPFKLLDEECKSLCDIYLKHFDTSTIELMQLLSNNWPHFYQPINFADIATNAKKLKSFQKNLVLLLHRNKENKVEIMLQEYSKTQRYIIPADLEEVELRLAAREEKLSLKDWFIPENKINELIDLIAQLVAEEKLTTKNAENLENALAGLINSWNKELKILHEKNIFTINYIELKKQALASYRKQTNKKISGVFVNSFDSLLSYYFNRPLNDLRDWSRKIAGIQKMHLDKEKNIFMVGVLGSLEIKLARQPSISQWHTLQGEINTDLIFSLLDADWVSINQLPSNPYPRVLINRWHEINPDKALLPD